MVQCNDDGDDDTDADRDNGATERFIIRDKLNESSLYVRRCRAVLLDGCGEMGMGSKATSR